MKKLLVLLLLLAFPALASPSVQMLTFDTGNAGQSASTTIFVGPTGSASGAQFNFTAVPLAAPASATPTLNRLRVELSTAVLAGSYTETVFINNGSTALTCTITSGTTCSIASTVSLSPGDLVALQSITATSTTVAAVKGSVEVGGVTDPIIEFCSFGAVTATSTTFYAYNVSTTEALISIPIALGGTVKNLYVSDTTAAIGSNGTNFAISIAGSVTGTPHCSMAAGVLTCSDLVTTHSLIAGDLVSIKYTPIVNGIATRSCAAFQIH